MTVETRDQFVFYTIKVPSIKSSKLKNFVIVEVIIGTGLYYAFKLSTSSEIIGILGSIVGIAGIRKIESLVRKWTNLRGF